MAQPEQPAPPQTDTPPEPVPDEADTGTSDEPADTQTPDQPPQAPDETDTEEEPQEPSVTDVPEPDQEPHEPQTPERLEQAFKKIERSHKTYVRAVSNALEESATDLLPCPLCEGAVPAFVNRHDAGHVDPETAGAVYAFLNMTPPEQLRESRLNERCGTCGGHGKLVTGSLVPQYETRVCDECNGFGFTGPGNPKYGPTLAAPETTESTANGQTLNVEYALAAIKGGAEA